MTFTSDKRREGGEVMSDKVTPEAVKAVLDALVGPTAAVLVLSALVALAVCAVVVGLCVAGIRLGVSLAVGA